MPLSSSLVVSGGSRVPKASRATAQPPLTRSAQRGRLPAEGAASHEDACAGSAARNGRSLVTCTNAACCPSLACARSVQVPSDRSRRLHRALPCRGSGLRQSGRPGVRPCIVRTTGAIHLPDSLVLAALLVAVAGSRGRRHRGATAQPPLTQPVRRGRWHGRGSAPQSGHLNLR
jgi:hypothetical protein